MGYFAVVMERREGKRCVIISRMSSLWMWDANLCRSSRAWRFVGKWGARQLDTETNFVSILHGVVWISMSILGANDYRILCIAITGSITFFTERSGVTYAVRKLAQHDSFQPFRTLVDTPTESLSCAPDGCSDTLSRVILVFKQVELCTIDNRVDRSVNSSIFEQEQRFPGNMTILHSFFTCKSTTSVPKM